jgi:hypothetical protein
MIRHRGFLVMTRSGLAGNRLYQTGLKGNPDWASRPDFAHIQRLEVRVALLPLLLGDLSAAPDPASSDQTKPDALDRPFPLDWLAAIDAELELDVGHVMDSPVPVRNATATAKLSGGELALSPWRATLAETPAAGALRVVRVEDAAEIRFTARTQRLDLGHVLGQLEGGGQIRGNVEELTLAVSGRGPTARALLQDADLSLKARKARITSGDDTPEKPWTLDIAAAEIGARAAQPTTISAAGEYRGIPLELSAETMTLEALASETESWPLSLEARSSQAKLVAEGGISRRTGSTTLELQATLKGDRIASLNSLLGVSLPDAGPYGVSAASMVGVIALAGVVVRNSLLLIDFARDYQGQGYQVCAAVREAGAVRLRPIALTTVTILFGVSPMVPDPVFGGLAISLIFGSLSSALFAVLVVPLLYRHWAQRQTEALRNPLAP